MGFNLAVSTGTHAALAPVDFAPFERALAEKLGAGDDAPYTLERHQRARIVRLAHRDVPQLVNAIGALARRLGLTSAGER